MINARYEQLCHLAEYDPERIAAYERAPIMEYYMILNSRVQAAQKANAANSVKASKRNR